MFSGIVRNIGQVIEITGQDSSKKIKVSSPNVFSECQIGDSIAVNGVCLTATSLTKNTCEFDLASETLRRTSLNELKTDSKLHLELSLKLGDKIDGHFVYGHVDEVGKVANIIREGETWKFIFEISNNIVKYLAPKGSITIDGVSLTLGEICENTFSVYIVPHTYQNTLFISYQIGSKVNIEIDPIARYVINSLRPYVRD